MALSDAQRAEIEAIANGTGMSFGPAGFLAGMRDHYATEPAELSLIDRAEERLVKDGKAPQYLKAKYESGGGAGGS